MFPSDITILIQIQYAENAEVLNTNDVLCRFDKEYKYRDAQRTASCLIHRSLNINSSSYIVGAENRFKFDNLMIR